jgi:hypothetical protein
MLKSRIPRLINKAIIHLRRTGSRISIAITTVFGGDANNTAQSYDLSINGPIAGHDQIIRDINTLNVNINKLFVANIKLTDKIALLTLSTTVGLDVNLDAYQAATMQPKKCDCPTNGGVANGATLHPNDAVNTCPAQGQVFSGGEHASTRMLLLVWE